MKRKLWMALCTSVLTVACFLIGSPAAQALGSEVLGCSFDSGAWYANTCEGGGVIGVNNALHFSPHNMSGTYSMTWTVTNSSGSAVPNCSSTQTINCISSGCTVTSTTCNLVVHSFKASDTFYTASLKLVQSGLTRTITATAIVNQTAGGCTTC
jgi:hypothetical protein